MTSIQTGAFRAFVLCVVLLFCAGCGNRVRVEEFRRLGPLPVSEKEAWTLPVKAGDQLSVSVGCRLDMGELALEAMGPDGALLASQRIRQGSGTVRHLLGPFESDGDFLVGLAPKAATGSYSLQVRPASRSRALLTLGLKVLLLFAGSALAVVCAQRWGAGAWRWFAAGAGVWALGQVLLDVFNWRLQGFVHEVLQQQDGALAFFLGMAAFRAFGYTVFLVLIFYAVAAAWEGLTKTRERCLGAVCGAAFSSLLITGLWRLWSLSMILRDAARAPLEIALAASLQAEGPLAPLAEPAAVLLFAAVMAGARYAVLRGTAEKRPAWVAFGALQVFAGALALLAPKYVNPLLVQDTWWSTFWVAVVALFGLAIAWAHKPTPEKAAQAEPT